MTKSESIASLALALAKAQGEFQSIERTRTVKIPTKTGGQYTYDYAPLDEVLAKTRPALSKNELALTQILHSEGAIMLLETMLAHKSGEFIVSVVKLASVPQDPKELGSLITYARRYAVQCILGVASEEDDDGEQAVPNRGNTNAPTQQRPIQQPRATAAQMEAKANAPTQRVEAPPREDLTPPAGLTDPNENYVECVPKDVKVYPGKTNPNAKKWGIELPEGIVVGTWDADFGKLAEDALESGKPIGITYTKSKCKKYWDVVNIAEVNF